MFLVHREEEWNNLLDNLKPNDPKVYNIAKSQTHKQAATKPLFSPYGLVFDQETKSELFSNSLETQFTYPVSNIMTTQIVKEKLKILTKFYPPTIQPITPNEVRSIIKTLPKKRHQTQMGYPTQPFDMHPTALFCISLKSLTAEYVYTTFLVYGNMKTWS
ncbi:unnamed protein product [Macrosiphum euphorbiae]|uniref:Uncharacterized protein n=1 Tax=Macrosiphum euphorbiae TaxID=13131 RepID=A0AAV0W2H5_9HEMI|nr:unnamed protein product [Macrosiphum euphorbiae]